MRILARPRLTLFVSFALLAAAVCQQVEAQHRTAIYLDCPAEDSVGESLCFLVREQIRKAVAFSLALEPKDAFVWVRIKSIDINTPPGGQASSVAVVMTLAETGRYLYGQVLFVGRDTVDTAAVSIVAGIDKYLDQLFKDAHASRQHRSK